MEAGRATALGPELGLHIVGLPRKAEIDQLPITWSNQLSPNYLYESYVQLSFYGPSGPYFKDSKVSINSEDAHLVPNP